MQIPRKCKNCPTLETCKSLVKTLWLKSYLCRKFDPTLPHKMIAVSVPTNTNSLFGKYWDECKDPSSFKQFSIDKDGKMVELSREELKAMMEERKFLKWDDINLRNFNDFKEETLGIPWENPNADPLKDIQDQVEKGLFETPIEKAQRMIKQQQNPETEVSRLRLLNSEGMRNLTLEEYALQLRNEPHLLKFGMIGPTSCGKSKFKEDENGEIVEIIETNRKLSPDLIKILSSKDEAEQFSKKRIEPRFVKVGKYKGRMYNPQTSKLKKDNDARVKAISKAGKSIAKAGISAKAAMAQMSSVSKRLTSKKLDTSKSSRIEKRLNRMLPSREQVIRAGVQCGKTRMVEMQFRYLIDKAMNPKSPFQTSLPVKRNGKTFSLRGER